MGASLQQVRLKGLIHTEVHLAILSMFESCTVVGR